METINAHQNCTAKPMNHDLIKKLFSQAQTKSFPNKMFCFIDSSESHSWLQVAYPMLMLCNEIKLNLMAPTITVA